MRGMTGFWEWLGRVIMLVLAGMITLSIIGAIASISSGTIERRFGVEPRARPELPALEEPVPPPAPLPAPQAQQRAAGSRTGGQMVAVPKPEEPMTPVRWLEAITYALLAIAGLLAFAGLLLWRAVHHWRRSADALEALALRRS